MSLKCQRFQTFPWWATAKISIVPLGCISCHLLLIHFPPRVTLWKDSGKEGWAPIAERFASFVLIWRIPSFEGKVGIIQWHKLKKENKGIHPVLLQFSDWFLRFRWKASRCFSTWWLWSVSLHGRARNFCLCASFVSKLACPDCVLELGEVLALVKVTCCLKAALEALEGYFQTLRLAQDCRLQLSKVLTCPFCWCGASLAAKSVHQVAQQKVTGTTLNPESYSCAGKGLSDVALANQSLTLWGSKEGS